ncbi:hypothetical protein LJC56_10820 [Christensenellaceae bacterium OttesenSCG-928-K19]|nr:hypothetical protein [Christensenellaceae bacterium OttesenSCG-928-K19]
MDDILSSATEYGQTAILVLLVAWALRCAAKCERKWLFQLLAGAFCCFLLGNIYLMLHVWVMDDWAFVFSPADVSWLGLYSFFIAVDLGLMSEWTQQEQQRAKKYRRMAWLGPAVVIAFHISYIVLYPEIWPNNLVFCIVLSFLGYYAFLMFFTSRAKVGIQTNMHTYHGVMMFFLFVELILFFVSSFGGYPWILYYAILWALTAGLCLLVPAAKKGATA